MAENESNRGDQEDINNIIDSEEEKLLAIDEFEEIVRQVRQSGQILWIYKKEIVSVDGKLRLKTSIFKKVIPKNSRTIQNI